MSRPCAGNTGAVFYLRNPLKMLLLEWLIRKRGDISMTNEMLTKIVLAHNESDLTKVDSNLYATKDFIVSGGVLDLSKIKSKSLENNVDN